MMLKKVAFPAFLLSASLYILIPTPDELVWYPLGGFFFAYVFHIPFILGVFLTMIIYRGAGVACLIGALMVGGKPIYRRLKQKFLSRSRGGPYRI